MSAAKRAALDLFAKGISLGEVVERTGRSHGTVVKYLCEFIEDTRPASVGRWVCDETYEKVAAVAGELGTARLRPIFERLDEKVPYDEIRLVATHLEVRDD